MTGWSCLIDLDEERVLIAIVQDLCNALNVARGFTFLPELLARTAPKPGETAFHGLLQRCRVHVRDHEDLVCSTVLDDSGDEAFFIVF